MFPYDDPQTVHNAIQTGIKLVEQTRGELDHVHKGLLALGSLYGFDGRPPAVAPAEDPVKAAEREADAKFADDMKAKQEAAQAQVFGGWQCPTHGAASVTTLLSRKKRQYRACIECNEFEKEVVA